MGRVVVEDQVHLELLGDRCGVTNGGDALVRARGHEPAAIVLRQLKPNEFHAAERARRHGAGQVLDRSAWRISRTHAVETGSPIA